MWMAVQRGAVALSRYAKCPTRLLNGCRFSVRYVGWSPMQKVLRARSYSRGIPAFCMASMICSRCSRNIGLSLCAPWRGSGGW